jgi:hypothetical protein
MAGKPCADGHAPIPPQLAASRLNCGEIKQLFLLENIYFSRLPATFSRR